MIRLDLYRLLPETHYIGVDDEANADCRFTPYNVFILETRLYPMIYKMFPHKNIEIYLKSEYDKDRKRMAIYLTIKEENLDPFAENNLIELTQEQRKIIENKIFDIQSNNIDYALIDIHELYNGINIYDKRSKNVNNLKNKIPFSWFSSILPYTGLNSSYNPFIRPEGIYLKFNPVSDYKKAYYDVCRFLIDTMKDLYKRGAIIIDAVKQENYINNWNLIPLDNEEIVKRIYEPNWTDDRFAKNKVDFLYRKIEGDPYIRLLVTDNLVKRHAIAIALQKFPMIFEGSYCKIEVKTIEEAYEVSALVTAASTLNGRVLALPVERISKTYLYFDYANKKYGNSSVINYSVNSIENPYIFSCLLPDSEKKSLHELREEFRNYALDRLLDATKIVKLSNMSPHDIIIKEYS